MKQRKRKKYAIPLNGMLWRWKIVTLTHFVRCVHRISIEHFIVLKVSIFTSSYVYFQSECVCACASMFTSENSFPFQTSLDLFFIRKVMRRVFYCVKLYSKRRSGQLKPSNVKMMRNQNCNSITITIAISQLNKFFGI